MTAVHFGGHFRKPKQDWDADDEKDRFIGFMLNEKIHKSTRRIGEGIGRGLTTKPKVEKSPEEVSLGRAVTTKKVGAVLKRGITFKSSAASRVKGLI